jgi:hypothetical protein
MYRQLVHCNEHIWSSSVLIPYGSNNSILLFSSLGSYLELVEGKCKEVNEWQILQ